MKAQTKSKRQCSPSITQILIKLSHIVAPIFFPLNYTKELLEKDHGMVFSYSSFVRLSL